MLTDAGKAVLPRARGIQAEAQAAREEVQRLGPLLGRNCTQIGVHGAGAAILAQLLLDLPIIRTRGEERTGIAGPEVEAAWLEAERGKGA